MAKAGIIGAGSWGIALAVLLNNNGHTVTVRSSSQEVVDMLRTQRENKDKLPNVKLSEDIMFTTDISEAVCGMDLVIIAVTSKAVRDTAQSISKYVSKDQIIVNVSKGIEESTLMTLSQVIGEEVPNADVAVRRMRKRSAEGFQPL